MKKSKLYKLFKFILISFPFILLFLDVFRNGFSNHFIVNGSVEVNLITQYLINFYDYIPDFLKNFFSWFDGTLPFNSAWTQVIYGIVGYSIFLEIIELFYYVITFIIRFAKNLLTKFIND